MKFTLITFLLALLWLTPGHAEVIYLDSQDDRLVLHNSIEILQDRTGTLDLEDVLHGPVLDQDLGRVT